MDSLPIDARLPEIVAAVAARRAAVVVAEPGAGKTTRVPPALVDVGPVLLLQPRRSAARAIAARIAQEQGWTLGHEVGWQIRFDRRFRDDTRLLVATEGVLTGRLQHDPLLSDFTTIIIDEFHERSVHADLGLALARQAWLARSDLRIVVMSATLDAEPVAAFLGGCPVIRASGRSFPVETRYDSQASPVDAVSQMLTRTSGGVLCFLAGAADVDRVVRDVSAREPGVQVLPLHGGLEGPAQDRALARPDPGTRRVIVATNIAETSVTVPGITAVVDSGHQKVARYDAARAIDSLVVERVTLDAADQRAGRAGRTAPGHVCRLWSASDRLRTTREPELHRIDLSGAVLDLMACGEDPTTFAWFESPRHESLSSALVLLNRLGAVHGRQLTELGLQMRGLPLHPRLARMFVAGNGSRQVARACALLSERSYLPARTAVTSSDLLSALDNWPSVPRHVDAVAAQLERLETRGASSTEGSRRVAIDDAEFRRVLLTGYPDRVAQRRSGRPDRFKLASGTGAALSSESGVRAAEYIVALDVTMSTRLDDPDARIRFASAIDKEWLVPTSNESRTWLDEAGVVRAASIERYDSLALSERITNADPEAAAALLGTAWLERARSDDDERLVRRLMFAGRMISLQELAQTAAFGKRGLDEMRLEMAVPSEVMRLVARDAPDSLLVPSGRAVRLEYRNDGSVSAAVKLQELFGLGETPRVGPNKEPVVFSLLAPNGRPVQVTRDLQSFWTRTYPEVRKELRGRYPRHPWPEDPWTAIPTARATRRGVSKPRRL